MRFDSQSVERPFWLSRLAQAWKLRRIVWLRGLRRAGKTELCRQLPNHLYFDFTDPGARIPASQPAAFWKPLKGRTVILDELHYLDDPSTFLKVAHDSCPTIGIVATGSSTMGLSRKFTDALTGRKTDVWLTPMNAADLSAFGRPDDWRYRLGHGGMPEIFLRPDERAELIENWVDGFVQKDILRLYSVGRPDSLRRLLETLLARSGEPFEASPLEKKVPGIKRDTIQNYVQMLEDTQAIHLLRPFYGDAAGEIKAQPMAWGFDTGFVRHYKAWDKLRETDYEFLWRHAVLNELQSYNLRYEIRYWRPKGGRYSIDFVLIKAGKPAFTVTPCWNVNDFAWDSLRVFRRAYSGGGNLVVTPSEPDYSLDHPGDVKFSARFVPIEKLGAALMYSGKPARKGAS
jgi:predicted AAA+ superfamily ATPase